MLLQILLIESNEKNVPLFEQAFEEENLTYRITHFSNPKEALSMLEGDTASFDMIIYSDNKQSDTAARFLHKMNELDRCIPFTAISLSDDGTVKVKSFLSSELELTQEATDGNPFKYIPRFIRHAINENDQLQELNQARKDLVFYDIKLKQIQSQLIQQEKLASIGQLAAGIAHEINNPLGFISSNFTTLQDYLKIIKSYLTNLETLVQELKPGVKPPLADKITAAEQFKAKEDINYLLEDTDDIFAESVEGFQRMMSIIQNLKSFSRVDHEMMKEYDVNKALETTLTVARNEIKYVAKIEKEFSEIPYIECKGDEINQVFLNITVNAAQAIKSQNRSELGTIKIKTYSDQKHVTIEISDDGPGIPQQIINKIFDPFFTTKGVGKGTGLGLNISHNIIVENHNGELSVKSKVGEGTKFIIKLPLLFEKGDEK